MSSKSNCACSARTVGSRLKSANMAEESSGDRATIVVLFVFSTLSILTSCFVLYELMNFKGIPNVPTRLLKHMHITLIITFISGLPYIYSNPGALCNVAGFFNYYGGLANALVILWLNIAYRHLLISDFSYFYEILKKYMLSLIYIYPCIAVLPFITNSYGTAIYSGDGSDGEDRWCSADNNKPLSTVWVALIGYGSKAFFLFISLGILCKTLYDLYIVEKVLALRLIRTTGVYTIISLASWVPTFFSTSQRSHHLYTALYFSIWCILYFVTFQYERKGLQEYQLYEESLYKDEMSSTNEWGQTNSIVDGRFSVASSFQHSFGGDSEILSFEKPSLLLRALENQKADSQQQDIIKDLPTSYEAQQNKQHVDGERALSDTSQQSEAHKSVDTVGKLINAAVNSGGHTRSGASYRAFMHLKLGTASSSLRSAISSEVTNNSNELVIGQQNNTSEGRATFTSGEKSQEDKQTQQKRRSSGSSVDIRSSAFKSFTSAASARNTFVEILETHRERSKEHSTDVESGQLSKQLAAAASLALHQEDVHNPMREGDDSKDIESPDDDPDMEAGASATD